MSSDAVKRIMAEVRELRALENQPGSFFVAAPLETDLFEWHFTVRGPPDTPFAGGLYHGRILLPPEYPLKAPEIILLTPNGRFEVGTRICLSVTSHHNETWQPSWGVRTILTALVGFMPSKSEGLGALDYPPEERRALARKSLSFTCPICGARPAEQFPDVRTEGDEKDSSCTASSTAKPVVHSPNPAQPSSPQQQPSSASSVAHSAPAEQTPRRAVRRSGRSPSSRPSSSGQRREEKELLYLALAISVVILAIIARRVVSTVF